MFPDGHEILISPSPQRLRDAKEGRYSVFCPPASLQGLQEAMKT
jgi:hypothetical protein